MNTDTRRRIATAVVLLLTAASLPAETITFDGKQAVQRVISENLRLQSRRVDSRTLRRSELAVEQAALSLEHSRAEWKNSLATVKSLLGIDNARSARGR
ncbi:MAG: hypothetical protein ACOCXE_01415, partial [Spirochaetota bacterium]